MRKNAESMSLFYMHPAVRYVTLAWFVYGCIEREHLLTLRALTEPALRWVPPVGLAASASPTRTAAQR